MCMCVYIYIYVYTCIAVPSSEIYKKDFRVCSSLATTHNISDDKHVSNNTGDCGKTLLLNERWPCNPARTSALQPLIWCVTSLSFQIFSALEEKETTSTTTTTTITNNSHINNAKE